MYELSTILVTITSVVVMADTDCNQYGFSTKQPGKSCRDIYQLNPASRNNSGYYIVKSDDVHFVYCDMILECGGEKGWMRIADINPANGGCPNGGGRLLLLLLLVDLLMVMLVVFRLISLLVIFHTVGCVEWYWIFRRELQMGFFANRPLICHT